jgi:hypothetical protein
MRPRPRWRRGYPAGRAPVPFPPVRRSAGPFLVAAVATALYMAAEKGIHGPVWATVLPLLAASATGEEPWHGWRRSPR